MSVAAFMEGLNLKQQANPEFIQGKHRLLVIERDREQRELFHHPMLITPSDSDVMKYIDDADAGVVMIIDILSAQRYFKCEWKEITCYDE